MRFLIFLDQSRNVLESRSASLATAVSLRQETATDGATAAETHACVQELLKLLLTLLLSTQVSRSSAAAAAFLPFMRGL